MPIEGVLDLSVSGKRRSEAITNVYSVPVVSSLTTIYKPRRSIDVVWHKKKTLVVQNIGRPLDIVWKIYELNSSAVLVIDDKRFNRLWFAVRDLATGLHIPELLSEWECTLGDMLCGRKTPETLLVKTHLISEMKLYIFLIRRGLFNVVEWSVKHVLPDLKRCHGLKSRKENRFFANAVFRQSQIFIYVRGQDIWFSASDINTVFGLPISASYDHFITMLGNLSDDKNHSRRSKMMSEVGFYTFCVANSLDNVLAWAINFTLPIVRSFSIEADPDVLRNSNVNFAINLL